MTPQGQVFNQKIAEELAKEEELVLNTKSYAKNFRFYNKCWGLRKFSGSNIYFFAKK